MCSRSDFVRFLANISNRFSIIKYDFWCFEFDVCEIDEQIIDAIFVHVDTIFDVKTERRDDFDAMTERETISTQNIDFLDVDVDVANEIIENEISMICSEWLTDDVSINVDSLIDKNVAKSVSSAIVIVTIFDFDVEKNVDIAISFDVDFPISSADFVDFWWWFCTWICNLMLLENFVEQRLHANVFARFFAMRTCSTFCFCAMRIASISARFFCCANTISRCTFWSVARCLIRCVFSVKRACRSATHWWYCFEKKQFEHAFACFSLRFEYRHLLTDTKNSHCLHSTIWMRCFLISCAMNKATSFICDTVEYLYDQCFVKKIISYLDNDDMMFDENCEKLVWIDMLTSNDWVSEKNL